MNTRSILANTAILLLASAGANAQARWDLRLGAVADEEDSRSLDADLAFAPSQAVQFSAGIGSTRAPSASDSIDGTTLRGAMDLHAGRFGVRGYYRQWTSDMLDTDTLGARASWTMGPVTLGVAGEARGFDVDYVSGGSDPQRSTENFEGTGWGGGLKYSRAGWTTYADVMIYEYDDLSRSVQTQSPGQTQPPGFLPQLSQSVLGVGPGLNTSTVTIGEGALDRMVSAGIQRGFKRASFRLEWTGVKDAIVGRNTDIYRAGLGYVLTEHVHLDVMGGVADSYAGSAAFGGMSVGLSF